MKRLGLISLVIALLAIPPSLVSGIGFGIALLALVLSGISALSGNLKYVGLVFLVTTINLFGLSVATTSWTLKQYEAPYPHTSPPPDWPESKEAEERKSDALYGFIRAVTIPYGVTLLCAAVGVWRRTRRHT